MGFTAAPAVPMYSWAELASLFEYEAHTVLGAGGQSVYPMGTVAPVWAEVPLMGVYPFLGTSLLEGVRFRRERQRVVGTDPWGPGLPASLTRAR